VATTAIFEGFTALGLNVQAVSQQDRLSSDRELCIYCCGCFQCSIDLDTSHILLTIHGQNSIYLTGPIRPDLNCVHDVGTNTMVELATNNITYKCVVHSSYIGGASASEECLIVSGGEEPDFDMLL
jgi:hypothetical protein